MCMGSDWAATTAHQPNCGSPSSGGCEHDRLKVCLEAREEGREGGELGRGWGGAGQFC